MKYHASEWQGATGRWYVADISDLAHNSAGWWIPPCIFRLSYLDYIRMLVNKYQVSHISYSTKAHMLSFSWDANKYQYAHRYLSDINKLGQNFFSTTM